MRKNKFVVLFAVVALVLASLACSAITGGDTTVNNTINVNNDNASNDNASNTNDGGISFSTANITNARLTSDKDGAKEVTSFAPADQYFYCYFKLNNAPDDTVVKGTWTLVSADGYSDNSEIDSAEVTGSDNTYYFSLSRSTDAWPVGKYKIDLYINGNLVQTIDFEVK
jgi:hypothetical protein